MFSGQAKYWNDHLEKLMEQVKEAVDKDADLSHVLPVCHDDELQKWHRVAEKSLQDAN